MNSNLKQIIVIRRDLNMRKGKMVSQGAHASMKAVVDNFSNPLVTEWLSGAFTKICVSVEDEDQLFEVYNKAKSSNVIVSMITDSGLTEFNGVPTNTCIAVGPDFSHNLDPITGHLKLL
jgi:PTH2 family peptidyl-tRNA hydrolase